MKIFEIWLEYSEVILESSEFSLENFEFSCKVYNHLKLIAVRWD